MTDEKTGLLIGTSDEHDPWRGSELYGISGYNQSLILPIPVADLDADLYYEEPLDTLLVMKNQDRRMGAPWHVLPEFRVVARCTKRNADLFSRAACVLSIAKGWENEIESVSKMYYELKEKYDALLSELEELRKA